MTLAEIKHLVIGHLAGPGEKIAARLKVAEALVQYQSRLLQHVVRVRAVGKQRDDKGINPGLMGQEKGYEFMFGSRFRGIFWIAESHTSDLATWRKNRSTLILILTDALRIGIPPRGFSSTGEKTVRKALLARELCTRRQIPRL